MKKFFLILFLIPLFLAAQPKQLSTSSTTTLLGSGATFKGALETVPAGYNWLKIVVKANKASATDGLVVRWAKNNTGTVVYNTIDKRSYAANDTLNQANVYLFPISGSYFKLSYTNTSSAQTGTMSITTYLLQDASPVNSTGQLNVGEVSGGATGGGYNKVTSTGGDSLVATETSYWRPTIRAVDDTVAFSKSRTYPSTDLNILYPGQSYTFTINMDVATMPKLYFKTFGTGTPTVQLKHEGR